MQNTPTQPTAAPWYKQPWPWILIALPATAVIAGFITLWLAIVSFDGFVSNEDVHRAKVGQGYEIDHSRSEKARALGLSGVLLIDPDNQGFTLRLDASEGTVLPPALMLTLQQPAHGQGDQLLVLTSTENPREYRARAFQPLGVGGRWQLQLEDESRAWRLKGNISLPAETREASLLP